MIKHIRNRFTNFLSTPIGMRFATGTCWSLAGVLFPRVLGFIISMLLSRHLGEVKFGQLGIIQSTISMFGVFAGFGMGITATKYIAEFRSKDPQKAGRLISLTNRIAAVTSAIMAVTLFFLSPWLSAHSLNAPELADILRLSSIVLFLSAFLGAQTGVLSGFEAFKSIAIINLWTGIINFPLIIGGMLLGGLNGIILGTAASSLFNLVLNFYALKKHADEAGIPLNICTSFEEFNIIWRFSVPSLLGSLLVCPVNWLCFTFLVNQHNGYSQMGVINAANQWYNAIIFLPGIVSTTVLPIMSEQVGLCDVERLSRILAISIKTNVLIVAPIVLVTSIASPFIMGCYGNGFNAYWLTLIIVMLTGGLQSIQTPVGQVIAASSRMWTGFFMNLGWAIAFIVATLSLVKLGALGLALGRLIAYMIHAVWTFGFAYILIKRVGQEKFA